MAGVSTEPLKSSMSIINWREIKILNPCRAMAMELSGGFSTSQEKPVGSTMTRSAPSATATEIGVLFAIPPSARYRPSSSTGGNTAGIAALASTASIARPEDRTTSVPVRMSVATT